MLKVLHTITNRDSCNARIVQHVRNDQCNTAYQQNEGKDIISTNAENASNKSQYLFMIKTLNKIETEGNYLNIIKAIYEKPIVKTILSGESEFFLEDQEQGKDTCFHHFYSTQYWKFWPE